MNRIDNLRFTPGRQVGLGCADDDLERIKATIGRLLHVEREQFNDIALEDIEVEREAQRRIFSILCDLIMIAEISADVLGDGDGHLGVPCTGFWIEGTLELILHAWNDYQSKTIVIPASDWFLREDIIVH